MVFLVKINQNLCLDNALSQVLDADALGRGPALIDDDVDLLLGLGGPWAGGGELLEGGSGAAAKLMLR